MRRGVHQFAAIPLVGGLLGVIFLIFAAAAFNLAWVVTLGFGLALAAAAVAFGVIARRRGLSRPDAPTVVRDADDEVYRALVITRDGCSPTALGRQLAARASGQRAEALVIAPVEGSGLSKWTGDEEAYARARTHLDETLAVLTQLGIEAQGLVGPRDPLLAVDDGLRKFTADEVVFASAPPATAGSFEPTVVEDARERYDLPVTVVPAEPPT